MKFALRIGHVSAS